MDHEILFVKLKNPTNIRRTVLELTKEVIENLQRHDKVIALTKEKSHRINALKIDIKEIGKLINKVRADMPKTKIKPELKKEMIIAQTGRKIKKVAKIPISQQPIRQLSELEKLDFELREIEHKLSAIK